jgi:hypothetical protein
MLTGRLKIQADYFCVKGFTFEGQTTGNKRSGLIYVSDARHIEILKNEIRRSFMSGIYVGDEGESSTDISIISNYIHNNGTHDRLDHGVYFGHADRGLIANNLVVGNLAGGLKIAPEADSVLVTQNTVVGNGFYGIAVGGEANWSSNNNVVVNNIVVKNQNWGIRSYWENVVGTGNIAPRNLIFGNVEGAFWFPRGGMMQERSILAAPQFISPTTYRLRATSPAVNRALRSYSMRVDFNGRSRRVRGRPDLGAFER